MNKLLLNPVVEIRESGSYFLDLASCLQREITIFPNVNATILLSGEGCVSDIKIKILDNSQVLCQSFGVDLTNNFKIDLSGFGASLKFVYSALCLKKESLKVEVHHLAANTTSYFYNHIVNLGKNDAFIKVDAYVPKGNKECILKQDNKIIPLADGRGTILPNLYVEEFDSFAEHSAYIAKFSKDALFYLQMRGISERDANFLLTKSFLLGNMELEKEDMQKFIEVIQRMRR